MLKTRFKKCQNPPNKPQTPNKTTPQTPPPPILCSLPKKNNQKIPYNNPPQTQLFSYKPGPCFLCTCTIAPFCWAKENQGEGKKTQPKIHKKKPTETGSLFFEDKHGTYVSKQQPTQAQLLF